MATRTATELEHAKAVRAMFSGIAGRYDLLNHVLSMNIDKRWRTLVRKKLQHVLDQPNAMVLDVACGTGDLSIELQANAKARAGVLVALGGAACCGGVLAWTNWLVDLGTSL